MKQSIDRSRGPVFRVAREEVSLSGSRRHPPPSR